MVRHVVDAEVRARATGRFADPHDALAFLGDDVGDLLDEKGFPDGTKIDAELDGLLDAKPHLAPAPRTADSADQGARGRPAARPASGDWARDLLGQKR